MKHLKEHCASLLVEQNAEKNRRKLVAVGESVAGSVETKCLNTDLGRDKCSFAVSSFSPPKIRSKNA